MSPGVTYITLAEHIYNSGMPLQFTKPAGMIILMWASGMDVVPLETVNTGKPVVDITEIS